MADGKRLYERMVRIQTLKGKGESKDKLLERGNTRTSTFNITYYPSEHHKNIK